VAIHRHVRRTGSTVGDVSGEPVPWLVNCSLVDAEVDITARR
jgi:hypothetical protein